MISLHSNLVYTYEQQIFIDEIQVYSRRHIQRRTIDPMAVSQIRQFLPYLISFISFVELSNI